jgi:hypothetical protein
VRQKSSEWRCDERHCISVLAVPLKILGSITGSVAAGSDRETHGSVHNWPSIVSLSNRALANPVAGRAQCTLTRSPGVRCFLRHIGAAGFLVKWAFCQEAVRLVVFVRELQR